MPEQDKTVGEVMDEDHVFDNADSAALGWRQDAERYVGERKQFRLDHAERLEKIRDDLMERV